MRKLKWGLIGCGDIAAKRVAPALRDLPSCDFVAVCRKQFELAESFAAQFGAKKWYKTPEELLKDDQIDAVYLATPVNMHCSQAVAAAQAGKHVLCEKPMAMNVAECDKMLDACRKNNIRLGVAYYRHFYPVVRRIKEIIASGEIGKPVLVQVNAFEFFDPAPDDPRHWFVEKAIAGGGPMFDFGCHRIEVLLNIFGAVRSVKGFADKILFDRDVEDTCCAFFKFECGANAILNVTNAALESQDTLDIFASNGSIHIAALNKGDMSVFTPQSFRTEEHPPHSNFHQPLIDDFTNAILHDHQPAVPGEIGREVARIEERIYQP